MAGTVRLTNRQARRFILRRLGLAGPYQYSGKAGVLAYIQSVGSLQLDPVDVCGKSAEIVLHSRVQGFKKPMLDRLLYKDRALFEYYDKQLCAIPVQDWPWLAGRREERLRHELTAGCIALGGDALREALATHGPLPPSGVPGLEEHIDWPGWDNKGRRLGQAVTEAMYHTGELVIHHREGGNRYFDFARNCLPAEVVDAPRPYTDIGEYYAWTVARRIGACGLLMNRASDAWLGTPEFTAARREAAFETLLREGKILEVAVEGVAQPLYCLAGDAGLLAEAAADTKWRARTELIAPLDSLIWDRQLVEELFGFHYKWEIYTPKHQRKYGHYTLPILWGERFVGRISPVRDKEANLLRIQGLWLEKGVRDSKALNKALANCLTRFARFNGCGGYELA